MKIYIYGKTYDTKTAKLIGMYKYYYPEDSHFWLEALYVTKKGDYFLLTEDGPYTLPGSFKKISPQSFESAKDWAYDKLDADAYIAWFGEATIQTDNNYPMSG